VKRPLFAKITVVFLCAVLLFSATFFTGCQKSCTYEIKNISVAEPLQRDNTFEQTYVLLNDDAYFFLQAASEEECDVFVNAQYDLLKYLNKRGVTTKKLSYTLSEYSENVSDSENEKGYYDISTVKTYLQVLTTLQLLLGDYTNYGYLYALSNAIAKELNWQTDVPNEISDTDLTALFIENPLALDLSYICFSDRLSTQNVIDGCKVLSLKIFEKIDWKTEIRKPIDEQMQDFYLKVNEYASNADIDYERQNYAYAYFGENCPLKIDSKYLEIFVKKDFVDYSYEIYKTDFFGDYVIIQETADFLNNEVISALETFSLLDTAEKVTTYIMSQDEYIDRFGESSGGLCFTSDARFYIRGMYAFVHEYYHYIEYLLDPAYDYSYEQKEMFCNWGNHKSYYTQLYYYNLFTQNQGKIELFESYAGRNYEWCDRDYFIAVNLYCYNNNDYSLKTVGSSESFSAYLVDMYGEDVFYEFMLNEERTEEITGKTFETLRQEWEDYIKAEFSDVN